MLSSDKPRPAVSQAPIKFTDCHSGCGSKVEYRTNPVVCCPPCKIEMKRISARKSMERLRRSRGIRKSKGATHTCGNCFNHFIGNGSRREFCDDCGPVMWRGNEKRRLNRGISNLIRAGIKSGSKRRRKWETLVGYTLSDLMQHLERQFTAGMTWENRGDWHIDHVRPLCSFNFETPDCPQFREAWALTNLRPLWAKDNLTKSGTRTLLL